MKKHVILNQITYENYGMETMITVWNTKTKKLIDFQISNGKIKIFRYTNIMKVLDNIKCDEHNKDMVRYFKENYTELFL